MEVNQLKSYIQGLPVGDPPEETPAQSFGLDAETSSLGHLESVDIDKLPSGIVTGANLIAFSHDTPNVIRSSVALSLLAAQRVATKDASVKTPKEWFDRHNEVLSDLNWVGDGGSVARSTFKGTNVAVHQAIIPFLTAAFGPAVAAGAIILAALKQLQEIDKDAPWITLVDKQSRHFNVTEYQFSVVEIRDDQAHLRIASASFDATFGQTQVLFFRVKQETVNFESASGSFATDLELLTDINVDFKEEAPRLQQGFHFEAAQ